MLQVLAAKTAIYLGKLNNIIWQKVSKWISGEEASDILVKAKFVINDQSIETTNAYNSNLGVILIRMDSMTNHTEYSI